MKQNIKEQIEDLRKKLRHAEEAYQAQSNKYWDLMDAVQEIVLCGPSEIGLKYLAEIYTRNNL